MKAPIMTDKWIQVYMDPVSPLAIGFSGFPANGGCSCG